MHPPPLLQVDRLVRRFGGLAAVDGVSFTLEAGSILGVIGPNGAGKTTLFDLLAGSLRPTAGTILFSGNRCDPLPPHRRAGLGIGRTFQIPRPFAEMSVIENVMLGAQEQSGERILPNWLLPGRVAREEARLHDRAAELLAFVGLEALARSPARVLSGGQRKLLELARVLMGEPRLLLLDEPAAGVNPALLDLILDRLAAVHARGVALLLIEHNMDVIRRLCPRVLVMAQGRILADGTPAEVIGDARVVDAYLGGVAA